MTPVYAILRDDGGFLTMEQILRRLPAPMEVPAFERRLAHLRRDFRMRWIGARRATHTGWASSGPLSARTTTSATTRSPVPPRSAEDSR